MPVYLRPDELAELPQAQVEIEEEEENESMLAELWTGAKSGWVWLGAACVLLIGGLNLLKGTLIAMEKIRKSGGGFDWHDILTPSWMPLLFFAIFGTGFGAFLASRLSMGAAGIWMTAAVFGTILAVVGGIVAAIILPTGISVMCILALIIIAVSTVGGAMFQTHWAG